MIQYEKAYKTAPVWRSREWVLKKAQEALPVILLFFVIEGKNTNLE